ncbi:MAG: N-acetyltransferase [Flavobacteriaceae bacterium]|jgi:predicted N-acetyltransferase YhbS|nr:N-acetyltransferase [Flavobacteriaceae bacterium]
MNKVIRIEQKQDYKTVEEVIRLAFESEEMSDHREHLLVQRLRQSKDFVPALSLVCEVEGEIVGHILFTEIKIVSSTSVIESLALAPVSVLPSYQKQGIGKLLITEGHRKVQELGYSSIVVLGYETYYPKFGYQLASRYDIRLPFDVPEQNSMVIEFKPNTLAGVSGVVEYPKEFME